MAAIVGFQKAHAAGSIDSLISIYTIQFSQEDEHEGTEGCVTANALREFPYSVYLPWRAPIVARTYSKRVRTLCNAAFLCIRGDLCSASTCEALINASTLNPGDLLPFDAVSPKGLFGICRFLNGEPTQRRDRVPVLSQFDLSSHIALVSTAPKTWSYLDDKRILGLSGSVVNTKMYPHRLVDVLSYFKQLMSQVKTCTQEVLDCLGAVVYMGYTHPVFYSNADELFIHKDMRDDYDEHHLPILAVWNTLLHAAAGNVCLTSSILNLYSLLRSGIVGKCKGERNLTMFRQTEMIALLSIVSHLFPLEEDATPCSGIILPLPWFCRLQMMTPSVETVVQGIMKSWSVVGNMTSFKRVVLEMESQLHVLIMRRSKCCFSNWAVEKK